MLPLMFNSLSGKREGYKANAELRFSEPDSDKTLVIRFALEPGVPTKFLHGNYSWGEKSGAVTCTSIDFFGGQGGVPSIGGVFGFVSDGVVYKVRLPTTEMKLDKSY